MKYALNLADDGRVLSATFDQYAPPEQPRVDELPKPMHEYRYVDGEFIHDPLPAPDPVEPTLTNGERIAALEEKLAAYEAAYVEGVNEA